MTTTLSHFAISAALLLAPLAPGEPAPSDLSTITPRFGTWGFDLTGRKESVKPGDDFFTYANGAYLERTTIPPDRVRFGNFDALAILSEARVRGILEEAVKKPTDETRKIGLFYSAFMDEALAEKLGVTPIADALAKVKAAGSREELLAIMADPAGLRSAVFGAGISPDSKNPSKYAVYLGSGGLGLPDKDYYLKPSFAEIRAKYEAYISTMMTLIGWPEPAASAKEILAFETRLAEASWERAERRDRDKTYNLMTPSELAAYAPGFDFSKLLETRGLSKVARVIVTDNTAFPRKAAIFAETPLDLLKAWTAFGIANASAPFLSRPFVNASFEFNSKTLSGQPEQMDRWKRAVAITNDALGEAVGQAYVARYFPQASKQQMLGLVNNVKAVLAVRINGLDWMSDNTKKAAQTKLSKLTVKIGYPDKWRDYSALEVKPGELYGNVTRTVAFSWKRELDRLDQPVDRAEWNMPPQKVNAYYSPTMNEIVFPAAILQPPFFDPEADPAVNYGGIGGVIGHEISHGFDDSGRKYDGKGNLRNWWTTADQEEFEARSTKLVKQYDAYKPFPTDSVNGKFTLGENIGDLGGMSVAYTAYQLSLNGTEASMMDGFTGDQRFFIGWAQVWRRKYRDEELRKRLLTDPHSPSQYRCNGIVSNLDLFHEVFKIKPDSKMYIDSDKRVRIW